MNRININLKNKKTLNIMLGIILICIFSISIIYAALNTILNINGNAEIVASSWDIYLSNPKVQKGSVNDDIPIIKSKNSIEFNTILTTPGDYYEFTVDIINNGTIDAMINNIIMYPTLSTEQAKYFKYEVNYENGEIISTQQVLEKKSTKTIVVRVEYRSDLTQFDLPTTSTELNLSLTLEYVQSNKTNNNSSGNEPSDGDDLNNVNFVSGDIDTIGSEVCIGKECFYIIANDTRTVTLFAKYNLYVGNKILFYDGENETIKEELPVPSVVKQDESAKASYEDLNDNYQDQPWIGTVQFNDIPLTTEDNQDIYDSSVTISTYVEEYKSYIENMGYPVEYARLITLSELIEFGFTAIRTNNCSEDIPDYFFNTSYWVGTSNKNGTKVWYVGRERTLGASIITGNSMLGVRPVLELPIYIF